MYKSYYVYILASKKDGVLYIGVTNNIQKRTFEHQSKEKGGFTEKYNVSRLVYVEEYTDIHDAIAREKHIKKWNREWKVSLIIKDNPEWNDLSELFYL